MPIGHHSRSLSTQATPLEDAQFGILAGSVLAAPWLFGAWEMWWFWLFASGIFLSFGILALRVTRGELLTVTRRHALVLGASLPLLLYGGVRARLAGVPMDAERSFLLLLTPLLVGLQVAVGFRPTRVRLFLRLVIADLVLLGLYGLINHAVTQSQLVMWEHGYPGYVADDRMTGSYYCPDHFAGIMELLFAYAMALIVWRRVKGGARVLGVAMAILALIGVGMSKSRGAGLTVLVIVGAATILGGGQYSRRARGIFLAACASVMVLGLTTLLLVDTPYMQRFREYFQTSGPAYAQMSRADALREKLLRSTRGRMITGALRAWSDHPVWGIGPGMHPNLWPHYADSGDGNRELGQRPTILSRHFHSYEVHSDWVQHLEEYGLVGLLLLLTALTVLTVELLKCYGAELRKTADRCFSTTAQDAVPLAGLLALTAMAFHSLGDFNLQMPATVWLLAVLVSTPLATHATEPQRIPSRKRS